MLKHLIELSLTCDLSQIWQACNNRKKNVCVRLYMNT